MLPFGGQAAFLLFVKRSTAGLVFAVILVEFCPFFRNLDV
jgi:hypothetical protein